MNEIDAVAILRRGRRRELILRNKRRLCQLRDAADPFAVTDEVFQGLYQLNKEMVHGLITELQPHLLQAQRSTAIPTELKVLCALHFFGQGSYQKAVGSDSNLGLSQASVSNCIEEVTEALNCQAILRKWIYFPMTQNERRQLIQKNYQTTGFHGVLGFIDGTHVAIKASVEHEHLYVNRKSYHSINAQIVCDSELKILNCVARFPGSTHDSYIWSHSAAYREMKEVWESGEQCWLLGDSGYPHQPWLQVPILNAEDGSPEANYTRIHVRARSAVERCIGVLKGRFRCLLRHRVLEYTPTKAGRIMNACCVLHNMCILGGVPVPGEVNVEEEGDQNPGAPLPLENPRAILGEARVVRQGIVNR